MIKNISVREKMLAGATIGVIIAALLYNMVTEPFARLWKDLDNDIRESEILLAKHSRILRDRENIRSLNKEYSKFFEESILTPEKESALALGSIEKLARGANVHITNIKPMGMRKYDSHSKFTFKITSESRIGELAKFIFELQSSSQLLKVERMVLRAKERQPDAIKAILHITKISIFK